MTPILGLILLMAICLTEQPVHRARARRIIMTKSTVLRSEAGAGVVKCRSLSMVFTVMGLSNLRANCSWTHLSSLSLLSNEPVLIKPEQHGNRSDDC